MALNFYRRHGADCSGNHKAYSTSYEPDELRRTAKRCHCPIYVSGTFHRKYKRLNTECRTWGDARVFAGRNEAGGSWDVQPAPPKPEPAPALPKPTGITITEAADAFLARCQQRHISAATMSKYRT